MQTPAIQYQPIQLGLLEADADQPRKHFDAEQLEQLGQSIKTHGLVEPIIVRPNEGGEGFQIISGERRFRAAQQAGVDALPAIVRHDLVGEDVSVLQVIENLQRADLTLPELITGVTKLVEQEGVEKAAQLLSKSTSWVSKRSRPKDLAPEVREYVERGWIEDIEIALDLSKLMQLDEGWAKDLLADFDPKAAEDEFNEGKPTREKVRVALAGAKEYAEREEQDRIERAQRQAADESGDEKPSREQVQKQAKVDRKQIKKQVDDLNREAEAHQALMTAALYKTLGIKPPKEGQRQPIRLWFNSYSEWASPDQIPKTSAGVQYHVQLLVDLAIARKVDAATGGNLEIDAQLPNDLTLAELEKLAKALPGRIGFSSRLQLSGNKLAQLIPKLGGKAEDVDTNRGQDQMKKFLADCTSTKKGEAVKSAELFKVYQRWCTKHKETPLLGNLFGLAIAKAGITSHRLKTGVHYQNLILTGVIK